MNNDSKENYFFNASLQQVKKDWKNIIKEMQVMEPER